MSEERESEAVRRHTAAASMVAYGGIRLHSRYVLLGRARGEAGLSISPTTTLQARRAYDEDAMLIFLENRKYGHS